MFSRKRPIRPLNQDWPRDGSVLEERIISINYDPNRDAQIALTGKYYDITSFNFLETKDRFSLYSRPPPPQNSSQVKI